MKKWLAAIAASLAILCALSPAVAQWQVPQYSVPIGRGAGVTGFTSAAPGTAGNCLTSNGAANPSFQACGLVSIAAFGAVPNVSTAGQKTTNAAAIVAAFNTGKCIYIPPGTWHSDPIALPSVSLACARGDGNQISILQGTAGGSDFAFIHSNGIPIDFDGFAVVVPDDAASHVIGIFAKNTTGVVVRNVRTRGYYGFSSSSNTNVEFSNNIVDKWGINGVNSSGDTRVLIASNRVDAGTAGSCAHGIQVDGFTDAKVSYNNITGACGFGIQIALNGTNKGLEVHSNIITNSILEAIGVGDGGSLDGFSIIGNVGRWDAGISTDYGMHVDGPGEIKNGVVANNIILNSAKACIIVQDNVHHVNIEGNFCTGGTHASPGPAAITLFGVGVGKNPANIIVTGNYNTAANNFQYAVAETNAGGNPDSNVFNGNFGVAGSVSYYRRLGSSTKVIDLGRGSTIAPTFLTQPTYGAGAWYDGNATANRAFVGMDGAATDSVWRVFGAVLGKNALTVNLVTGGLEGRTFMTLGAAGEFTGQLGLIGKTSGQVTVQAQDAAGTYNFNLPTNAGTAGQPLLSGGGLTAPMTFGTLTASHGGSGATTLTGLLQGNGTSAFTAITNSSTVGQVLRVTGGATYAWGAVDLADSDAITGDLPFSNLTQGAALSVLGVTGNATADHASIAAGADHNILRRSGTSVGFGSIDLSQSGAVGSSILPAVNGGSGRAGGAWTTATPSLTCQVGSLTTASASHHYAIEGKKLYYNLLISITTAGTCAGRILLTMPGTATGNGIVFAGAETATGVSAIGTVASGTTSLEVYRYDGSTLAADTRFIILSGVGEIQ